nr:hypothetical protein RAR13_23940 [Aminobacter aminovorans]
MLAEALVTANGPSIWRSRESRPVKNVATDRIAVAAAMARERIKDFLADFIGLLFELALSLGNWCPSGRMRLQEHCGGMPCPMSKKDRAWVN